MSAPTTEQDPAETADQPPRIVLFALYVLLTAVLIAVLVIVGVYGA